MLQITELTRRYGERLALDRVSLQVEPGEIVGLLGANGAGKSTLLRIAAGLQTPDAGAVCVEGHDVWDEPIAARARLGYAAEEPTFYEELSGAEHAAFVAGVRGMAPDAARDRAHALAEALGMDARMDDPVHAYSHGMRKKLSFLLAVLHRPAVVLCDEALEGFDAPAALAAKDELRSLAHGGAALLFSSHVTETVERLCDRVVMLHQGRTARALARADWGAPEEVRSRLEREFLDVIRSN